MQARILRSIAMGIFTATPLAAQLPTVTAPARTLRIELRGDFYPTDHQFVDGTRVPLGAQVSRASVGAGTTLLLSDLEAQLTDLLGRTATATSLGGIGVIAERQRGVGTIGLGYGVSGRLTLFAAIPIVSARTQSQLNVAAAGATVGVNPSRPGTGDANSIAATATFFQQFDAALATVATGIANGTYGGDAAVAQQTLDAGTELRAGLSRLLTDPASAALVLPTATSADAIAILDRVGALQNDLARFGAGGFSASPIFPETPLDAAAFNQLLSSPAGLGVVRPQQQPIVSFGDVEIGAAYALRQRGEPGEPHWQAAWVRGLVRLPTGTGPVPGVLFDRGTGDEQADVEAAFIAELGAGRLGIRAEASYTLQLKANATVAVASPTDVLVPAALSQRVTRDPGDVVSITAQPFVHVAPHLAISLSGQYWRRSDDVLRAASVSDELLQRASRDTGGDAVRVGIGVNYSHNGVNTAGERKMPVEASWSLERTIASGRGVVDTPLTTRIMLRVYKGFFSR